MTTSDLPLSSEASRRGLLLPALTVAIFLSAALLFAVQPMFAKMVLPRLGGAPQVWSVAMVFFQAALLAGYGYAHLLTRFAPGRPSIAVHLAIMIVAALTLPLAVAAGWDKPPAGREAIWLLGLFTMSIGLPFFALSGNGPLLQAWFARTDHPAAKDPYFLYAASNVGSFLALISYPLVVEPFISLGAQSRLWSAGFVLLILLIAGCGYLLWRAPDHAPSDVTVTSEVEATPPTWRDAAVWVALAAVPSGLLVAVTAHISTDIAAAPLLWVVPLALYLLTFVIVFARRPLIPHRFVIEIQPLFIVGLMLLVLINPFDNIIAIIAVHLAVFFVSALLCHGELARRRPAPRYLTSFYMWLAAGGMIGGLLTGLAAPYTFNWIAEYPILIALAVLSLWLMPRPKGRTRLIVQVVATAVVVGIALFWNWRAALLLPVLGAWRYPLALAPIVAAILLAGHFISDNRQSTFVRSFFGVHKISESRDGRYRLLTHGTTIHGARQIRDDNGNPITGPAMPLAYYYADAPMGQAIKAAQARIGRAVRHAFVGLGSGGLACDVRPFDTVLYYEIDSVVVGIALNPAFFGFLPQCKPDASIMLGDARLTLAEADDGGYDVIVIDAFNSDAIPVHLLTREAMALYLQKLAPGGIIVMHISNRYLELASVVTNVAAANGLVTRVNWGEEFKDEDEFRLGGIVAAVARNEADFGGLTRSDYWQVLEPDPAQRVWTDDYSNIVGALLRGMNE